MDVKNLLKYSLYYSGMSAPSRVGKKRPRLWILSYHSVSDHRDQNFRYVAPNIAVSPRVFESHIAFLSRNYRIISLDDVVAWINGATSLPRQAVVITFDDGYRDNFLYAYPILKKYGVTGTFYVVTDAIGNAHPLWTCEVRDLVHQAREGHITLSCVGSQRLDLSDEEAKKQTIQTVSRIMRCSNKKARRVLLQEMREKLARKEESPRHDVMMNWDELREMKQGGMCIGSHSMSHPLLPEIPQEDAAIEIAGSKAKIEEELGAPVAHLAYPNPGGSVHVNEKVKALVRHAGYLTARKVFKGSVSQDSDLFELNGRNIGNGCNHPALLAWILS